jgi:hypothetical protein
LTESRKVSREVEEVEVRVRVEPRVEERVVIQRKEIGSLEKNHK